MEDNRTTLGLVAAGLVFVAIAVAVFCCTSSSERIESACSIGFSRGEICEAGR